MADGLAQVNEYLKDTGYALDYAYRSTQATGDTKVQIGQQGYIIQTGDTRCNWAHGCNATNGFHNDDLVAAILSLRNPSNSNYTNSNQMRSGFCAYDTNGCLREGTIPNNPTVTPYDNGEQAETGKGEPSKRYTGVTVPIGYYSSATTYTRDLTAVDPTLPSPTISSGTTTATIPKGYYSSDKSMTITGPTDKNMGAGFSISMTAGANNANSTSGNTTCPNGYYHGTQTIGGVANAGFKISATGSVGTSTQYTASSNNSTYSNVTSNTFTHNCNTCYIRAAKGYWSGTTTLTINGPSPRGTGDINLYKNGGTGQLYMSAAEGYYNISATDITSLPGVANVTATNLRSGTNAYDASGKLVSGTLNVAATYNSIAACPNSENYYSTIYCNGQTSGYNQAFWICGGTHICMMVCSNTYAYFTCDILYNTSGIGYLCSSKLNAGSGGYIYSVALSIPGYGDLVCYVSQVFESSSCRVCIQYKGRITQVCGFSFSF